MCRLRKTRLRETVLRPSCFVLIASGAMYKASALAVVIRNVRGLGQMLGQRSTGRVLWAAVLAFLMIAQASHADTPTNVITLSFDPENARLSIALPGADAKDLAQAQLPDWLEIASDPDADANTMVLQGVLPGIDATNPFFGAGATGAYMIAALSWLPGYKDAVADLITIRTPASYRGVVTGDLITEDITDDTYTATFQLDESWSDADVFFGPYVIEERMLQMPSGDIRLRTYFAPEDQGLAQDYLAAAQRYITQYAGRIGAYQNAGFTIVSAPIPVGYAFDGLTYISEEILSHPYMLGRSLAHEILHNWWGSGVRVDYDAGNWAEGLTTYQADYALAAAQGEARAKAMRRDWLAALTGLPTNRDRPLREFRSSGHDGHQSVGYGKSAMVFHSLHESLGTDVFDAALKRFWRAHNGHIAGWHDLKDAFEAEAGRDMEAFFSQSLDRVGLPEIAWVDAAVTDTANGFEVSFRLRQGDTPYAVRLPVVLETTTGREVHMVTFDKTVADFKLAVKDQPIRLSIDPDFHALRQLSEGELPATLQDVLRADEVTLIAHEGALDVSEQLLAQLFRNPASITISDTDGKVSDTTAIIAVGTAQQIGDLREAHFESDAPDIAGSGDSRVWVEVDRSARAWLFISAHDVQSLPDALSALRYYGRQSYLVINGTSQPETGRWTVRQSPLTVKFGRD